MVLSVEVERVVASTRATRLEIADLRRRTQQARLAVEWQRVRARREMGKLEQSLDALKLTIAQIGAGPRGLPWAPARDALDDVLFPLE
jgi:hypothetical protein